MNTRGGFRKGAGRKVGSGKYGEPTKSVRIPVSMVDMVQRIVNREIGMRALETGLEIPSPCREILEEHKAFVKTEVFDNERALNGLKPGEVVPVRVSLPEVKFSYLEGCSIFEPQCPKCKNNKYVAIEAYLCQCNPRPWKS